jgi:hypothetical protein
MAVLKSGSFGVNLGIFKLSGDLSDEDRQAAWELYTEISTRVAVCGKHTGKDSFEGEIYIESLNSLFNFFQEARKIMRSFPVGRLEKVNKNHLGIVINNTMLKVLRPFLEKWQANFRHWWENESNPNLAPFERQKQYPKLKEFLDNWCEVRSYMRKLEKELVNTYQLVNAT